MYNSDGYVMIDMSDVDLTKSSQNIPGIYKRVLEVIDTNKLALIVNADNNTPMAAVVHKKLNYYKITTLLYIFTINTNDIVIVEESGEATVDVEIVPTLTSGTKIADFSIGSIEGELFAPPQQSEINDNVTAVNSTWSSTKINNELAAKADTADVYTKAQVDTALSGKADTSDIPTKTSELTNDSGFITSAQVPTIDDNTVSSSKVWSSYKTSAELGNKANSSDVYTKSELDTALSGKANSADVYTKTEVDTALSSKADKSSINQISKIEVVQLFNSVAISNNSEYNSNGGTIPHATIPTKAGYTPVAIVNVQAMGYYGSRILLYAWIDTNDGKIHFSAFNTMENFQYTPTVIGYAWVLYIKSGLL